MLAERTKVVNLDRTRIPSVQSLTDKMSRLTNRKAHNPKLLLNELSSDRNVTFSNNHSASTAKATSSEGKKLEMTVMKGEINWISTSQMLRKATRNFYFSLTLVVLSFNLSFSVSLVSNLRCVREPTAL